MTRPLFVPVILGTPRQGRMSEHAAKVLYAEMGTRPGVETELVDIAQLPIPVDDAGEAAQDPRFAELVNRADALILVTPEYNHGYPGLLKHVLDTNLKEYIHKAAGIVGVSAGVFGGARAIQNLIPVLRELGLVTIFWDVNFTTVRRRFDESGNLVDDSFLAIDKFLDELLWMAETLRYGRENVTIGGAELTHPTMTCPQCGTAMNRQADKLVHPVTAKEAAAMTAEFDGVLTIVFACPSCGWIDSRRDTDESAASA